jgi:hypothetical protein
MPMLRQLPNPLAAVVTSGSEHVDSLSDGWTRGATWLRSAPGGG